MTATMTRNRGLDWAPLADYVDNNTTDVDLAACLGVTPRTLQRWRAGTPMRLSTAEDVADRLGVHPLEVWGEAYEAHCLRYDDGGEATA